MSDETLRAALGFYADMDTYRQRHAEKCGEPYMWTLVMQDYGEKACQALALDARPAVPGEPTPEDPDLDCCDFENCPGEVVAWTDRDKWCYAHAMGLFGEKGE